MGTPTFTPITTTAPAATIVAVSMEIAVLAKLYIRISAVLSSVIPFPAVMDVPAFIADVYSVYPHVIPSIVSRIIIFNAVTSYPVALAASFAQMPVMAHVSVHYHVVMIANVLISAKSFHAVTVANSNTYLDACLVVMAKFVTFVNVSKDVKFVIVQTDATFVEMDLNVWATVIAETVIVMDAMDVTLEDVILEDWIAETAIADLIFIVKS
jgi:hypothetical protein